MATSAELLTVPAFADLPEDQIQWFLGHAQEVDLQPGETYVRHGDPANAMFVILEGEFQWRGESAGEFLTFTSNAGEVTGLLPFSRLKEFRGTGKALTRGRLLRFPSSLFPELIQRMPVLTQRLV